MNVIVCKPGDPEAKGLVERANQYLETSFMPGRRFASPQDFNAQLASWLRKANSRVHSTLRCKPVDRDRRGPRRDDGVAAGAARPRVARDETVGP